MFLERLGDRRSRDPVVELLQLALDTAVAPVRVVGRHPHDQLADRLHDSGTADALAGVRPLRGDQLAVPAEDSVGRDDGGHLTEQPAPEGPALRGEAPALVIGQPQALAAELFLENAVLLDEVLNGLRLVAIDPAGEARQEELKTKEIGHVPTGIDTIGVVLQAPRSRPDSSSAEYSDRTGIS